MVPDGSLKIHINRNRNGYSYNIIYMNIHGSFFLMAKNINIEIFIHGYKINIFKALDSSQ